LGADGRLWAHSTVLESVRVLVQHRNVTDYDMIIAVERVMGRYNTGRDLSREIEEDRGGGFPK